MLLQRAPPMSKEKSGELFVALLGDKLLMKDESKMPKKEEPKAWACGGCTFENGPAVMQCEMWAHSLLALHSHLKCDNNSGAVA
jgi:hypothetical protein